MSDDAALERHLTRLGMPIDFTRLSRDVQARVAAEYRERAKTWRRMKHERAAEIAAAWDARAAFIEKHLVGNVPVEDRWGAF